MSVRTHLLHTIRSAKFPTCLFSVFVLERLTDENISEIIDRAIRRVTPSSTSPNEETTDSPSGVSFPQITPKVLRTIVALSSGDARTALSLLEVAIAAPTTVVEERLLDNLKRSVVARKVGDLFSCSIIAVFICGFCVFYFLRYDRTGDDHYDMISALHKSIRGSDGSAAMYWLAR